MPDPYIALGRQQVIIVSIITTITTTPVLLTTIFAVDSFGSTFHLHLLFKAGHEYRRSFCILQPAICPWGLLTARGFLPEAATPLASGKTAEKTVLQREEQQLSSWTPSEDSFPVFCVCLSPGQGFLPTKQRLLVLHFLNKLQFSFVMVKKNFFPIKSTYSHSILCLGLLLSFFDPKVTAPTIDAV